MLHSKVGLHVWYTQCIGFLGCSSLGIYIVTHTHTVTCVDMQALLIPGAWDCVYQVLSWTYCPAMIILYCTGILNSVFFDYCLVTDTNMSASNTCLPIYLCLRTYWHDENKRKYLWTCTSSPPPSQCFCPQHTTVPERSGAYLRSNCCDKNNGKQWYSPVPQIVKPHIL